MYINGSARKRCNYLHYPLVLPGRLRHNAGSLRLPGAGSCHLMSAAATHVRSPSCQPVKLGALSMCKTKWESKLNFSICLDVRLDICVWLMYLIAFPTIFVTVAVIIFALWWKPCRCTYAALTFCCVVLLWPAWDNSLRERLLRFVSMPWASQRGQEMAKRTL